MRNLIIGLLYICAALMPFFTSSVSNANSSSVFIAWPTEFEGRELIPLALTEKEKLFSKNFTGKIARFTDGEREILIRHLNRPTRSLHPSADCLRGAGYSIENKPLRLGQKGNLWGCVIAEQGEDKFKVCERIYDNAGKSWYDVSSWYWAAIFKKTEGAWWAITVAEDVG
ncbi:MAG: hypothetical protein GQ569_13410 [Methylococcaceae bacterium]|nr:hypothetical protein [Methylococcaceae bacterium]